jgi:hypothetical protein
LILRAAIGVLAKDLAGFEPIRVALSRARGGGIAIDERQQAHLSAAEHWLRGEPLAAARQYADIVLRWPRDLLALRLAQSCYFFLGQHAEMAHVARIAKARWTTRDRSYGFVLAMNAFAHAETGAPLVAERLGREALAIEPACPYGVHAVAHALWEHGEPSRGAKWMRAQIAHWASGSRMLAHNAWHLAMFELEAGRADVAADILDDWVLPHAHASAQDAADGTALLWRLERAGFAAGSRWRLLSDIWLARGGFGFWPYLDLHAAVAFHAAHDDLRAAALDAAVIARTRRRDLISRRAREVTLAGLRGIRGFATGAFDAAIRWLAPLHSASGSIGASRAQFDIFGRMLDVARAKRERRGHPPVGCVPQTAMA